MVRVNRIASDRLTRVTVKQYNQQESCTSVLVFYKWIMYSMEMESKKAVRNKQIDNGYCYIVSIDDST